MEWYYLEKRKPRGPLSEQEMRTLFRKGRLAWNAYVWNRDFTHWVPADEAGFSWPGFLPVAKFLIAKTFFLLLGVSCLLGIIPLTKWMRKSQTSLHENAKHQMAISEAMNRRSSAMPTPPASSTSASNASKEFSLKAMPLTRENAERYTEVYNEPLQRSAEAVIQHFNSSDLTTSPQVVDIKKQFFSDYPKSLSASAWGIRAIEKMGYDYNLTLKEILKHRVALESHFASAMLLEMAKTAAKEKDALLELNKIDRATYNLLQQEFPANIR